jgi:hypothetical protein
MAYITLSVDAADDDEANPRSRSLSENRPTPGGNDENPQRRSRMINSILIRSTPPRTLQRQSYRQRKVALPSDYVTDDF